MLQKDSENFLFGGTAGANPYAPGGNTQFQLPLSLNDATAVDEHGQIKEDSTSLDDVFNYVSVGDGSGIDNSGATPMFSTALKELFISQYILAEDLAALLETYEECEDDKDADKADACTSMANSVRALLTAVSNQGFERSQLDDSIALIFGNSTTIGQVSQALYVISWRCYDFLACWIQLTTSYDLLILRYAHIPEGLSKRLLTIYQVSAALMPLTKTQIGERL